MFAYASLLGIAKANGYIPYFPSSHPLTSIFSLSKIQSGNAECLQTVFDDRPCSYNSEFMNLPPGNISIRGYIQSWKYFRLMEKEIRKEFTLNKFVRTRATLDFTSYVGKFVRDGRPVVGVHVRRGDVLKPEARKLGFCHAPKSYLDNAMKYMLRKYPNAVFLVTSDDIEWCIENVIPPKLSDIFDSKESLHKFTNSSKIKKFQDKVPVVFSKGRDPWSDFSVLSLCNHSIITVGTFGWWSAWLANGHVVYYKNVPLPGTKLDYELTKEDYFPAHWVAL
ncbi:unnamed protein product [Candidula unifasciata]|uniref:L-Fucosyltransferase n=1 Tax=Candidula unifasciata TaxID=100452 RepID=A0A8S3ZY35_9EUPU|nr:unnamed protein product [Candidula unifasciata]